MQFMCVWCTYAINQKKGNLFYLVIVHYLTTKTVNSRKPPQVNMLRFEYPSKQLILRSPNSKEYPEILKQYFEYFLQDEPGSKSRGGYPRGIPLKVKDDIIKHLNEELSLVAVDSTNDQICGFAINYCIPRYFREGFKILF